MENLKIRVNNKAESKEAKELFFELGGAWKTGSTEILYTDSKYLYLKNGAVMKGNCDDNFNENQNYKAVSLSELRALVSLHKNPINMDKVLSEVRSDALGLLEDKEYLRRNAGGTYSYVRTVHPDHVHGLLIEIPEGANYAYQENGVNGLTFFKDDSNITHNNGEWFEGCDVRLDYVKECEAIQVWQRHTPPEELPFVDDECYTNKSNGGFKLPKDKPCDISKWSELRGESINDQYAEIEQVRQASITDTLNERQSTYGSFEDVANTTQYLLQMLSTDAMSDVQLEALHMICSKLARIAHGDPNYKDNWHDIAGYATLVERSL